MTKIRYSYLWLSHCNIRPLKKVGFFGRLSFVFFCPYCFCDELHVHKWVGVDHCDMKVGVVKSHGKHRSLLNMILSYHDELDNILVRVGEHAKCDCMHVYCCALAIFYFRM